MDTLSYAWRGPRGSGKRSQLLSYLEKKSGHYGIPFSIKYSTWFLTKQSSSSADPDDDDEDGPTGKSIPYEESPIHLGFDVARMSMSDKVFLQSILTRWTGQQDVTLAHTSYGSRYLVLYHAHYMTDESTLQLQEALEQYQGFAILLTTELPLCNRLRDYCLEIPVKGPDKLLSNYTTETKLPEKDVWNIFFSKTLDEWSNTWSETRVADIRNWIYICLQRNLRWSDVIQYWIEVIYETNWITKEQRKALMTILWNAESGGGWTLVTSYRIPILWEHVHLTLARTLYNFRNSKQDAPTIESSRGTDSKGICNSCP
jgi:hypothetical protein